nr:hypothetical protein CFP56_62512 [Quercus suber]
MSTLALSSAKSTTSTKTGHSSRHKSSARSLPSLYATSSANDSPSETDSDNLSDQADSNPVAVHTFDEAGPSEVARGMTTLSLALHDVVQTPISPVELWLGDHENARIERLFCNLAQKSDPNSAIESWLADEPKAESEIVPSTGEAVSTRS